MKILISMLVVLLCGQTLRANEADSKISTQVLDVCEESVLGIVEGKAYLEQGNCKKIFEAY